ncbi:MAG: hypothetical protein H6811_02190 [Phycisphaeraceae bacterium]|nr:hypothetical protein [Phycisphaeraceae bacterium]
MMKLTRNLLLVGALSGACLLSSPGAIGAAVSMANPTPDRITLSSGQVWEGEILEETETTIRMRVVRYGITAEQTFQKSEVLSVKRGERTEDPAVEPTPKDPVRPAPGQTQRAPADGAKRVYVVELDGTFGELITQTPMRQAVEDAQRENADYLIFVLDNEWRANAFEDLPDDTAAFDELFRAEEIHPIFTEDIPRHWQKKPEIVFWVKQAMGGAAFLPLVCKNIYFESDGRMGGIGNLSNLFGSMGDEVVRQKQYALRMGHAEGICIQGGYPVELVRAMAQVERVYSYRIEGGHAVWVENYPDPSRGEVLLTDDGKDERADTIQELARSQGNDVLTLNADLALTLGISKGTVDTLEDLLFSLGISRNSAIIDGQSKSIMDGWERSLDNAQRELRRLWQEAWEVQVAGDYNERTRARGIRRQKLERMQAIIRRYEEALGRFLRQNGIPGVDQLQQIIEQIKLEQLADKR